MKTKFKIITGIIISVLLIGIVIAVGELANKDKNLELTKEQKNLLATKGLIDYKITDSTIGTNYMERCLYKKNAINTCQIFLTYTIENQIKVYYTPSEMTAIMDKWEKERLELIAKAIKDRQSNIKTPVAEGTTTIKEIK